MIIKMIPLFLTYCRSECSFSDHTCHAYERDLNQFVAVSNYQSSGSLTGYYEWLQSQSFAPKTIHRKLASLRSFFQFCIQEGVLNPNVMLAIPRSVAPVRIPQVMDEETIELLFKLPNINTLKGLRDRVLLELLYSTGMRVSECTCLTPSQIDLMEGVITVTGKGDQQRLIPLTSRSIEYLTLYLAKLTKKSWVFEGRNNRPISRFTVYSIIKSYAMRLSKTQPISPHSFRHAFATHLLEGGARLRDVQILLGHKQLNSTQVYTNIANSAIKRTFLQAHPRGLV